MIDLRTNYGKRYKVTLDKAWEGGEKIPYYEIQGKRGYIRPWGEKELEVYLSNTRIAIRIERENKMFRVKNHYDDGAAFVITEEYLAAAVKFIKGKNRRQMSPEALANLARIRSLVKKPTVASAAGNK